MKTIMKRIAALVLIAAMAVMAVAGCSKSSGSKSAGNKSADTMFGLMKEAQAPVSYTHLTLPTILRV